jgi:hypothetical protein
MGRLFFKSVAKIEIGDCGVNGAMGSSLTDYRSYLVTGSFAVNFPVGTVINEYVDGADVPSVSIPGRSEGGTIKFRLESIDTDSLDTFLAGSTAGNVYTHNATRAALYQSVKITGDTVSGSKFVWKIPTALIAAGLVGNPSADAAGKVELDVTVTIMTGTDQNGAPVSPFTVQDYFLVSS